MAKKREVFKTAIVEKRNILNEVRKNNMSLQELRFFSIYLAKINARDVNTRVVKFPLDEFQKIMELQNLNIVQIRASFTKLLQQVVTVPNERGGFSAFQLFKECTLDKNEYGEWLVTIDAHDKALPLMFDFKNRYFSYELWNALKLKSTNQIRMYEVLKQYEKLGKRELPVQELRELLGIMPDEYSGRTGWTDFKKKVLDSCQQALKENTDICYTYEKGKSGVGGKWLTIVFSIFRNDEYTDQLTLDEFIEMQGSKVASGQNNKNDICNGFDSDEFSEFTDEQLGILKDLAWSKKDEDRVHSHEIVLHDTKMAAEYAVAEYLRVQIKTAKMMKPKNLFSYVKKMIENDK